jgi:dienelactone hydrolase
MELKPALWGVVGGAVAAMIIGFSWGGWVTGGTASTNADKQASTAVITALTPFCTEKFRGDANVATNLEDLKKANPWERSSLIEKGGWATLPGQSAPAEGVARACAEQLVAPA